MALTKFNNSRRQLNCAADNDELVAWAESIPLDGLWDEIKKRTGLSDLVFESRINTTNPVRIHFESQDLADRVGFLKLMFEILRIEDFNSEVFVREMNGVPTKIWWGTVCFCYVHPNGGINSMRFMSFWYVDGKGWQFDSLDF